MKTLVVHPKDSSTDFLSEIYRDRGWTVITQSISNYLLDEMIYEHDRIIMLGHGTPSGLIGFSGFAINNSYADLLKEKETVCIWCHANQFVERYGLWGLYSGMIISEYGEAMFCNVPTKEGEVEYSNKLFAQVVRKAIFTEDPVKIIKTEYVSSSNKVIQYNNNNVYYRTQKEVTKFEKVIDNNYDEDNNDEELCYSI